jgi:UDP-N-acetylglucosamine acyltransferase
MLADGNPLALRGLNIVGLRRRGFPAERMAGIKQMHRLLYRQGLTLEAARAAMAELPAAHPEAAPDIAMMLGFLDTSTRGIAR